MKRPEGFGRAPAAQPPKASGEGKSAKPKKQPKQSARAEPGTRPANQSPGVSHEADRELRKAAAARRRYERGEVRRFTRRSRRRRVSIIVITLCFVLLGGLVVGAIYSPVLSLRTISITGTARVDKQDVLKAVKGQIGTPLALVDFGAIRRELSGFPLIRSYVTESQPPDTLVIRISERSPIAILQNATGFSVIDPAGVVLQDTADRPAGLPELTGGAALTNTPAFVASVDVLLALPTDLRSKVDSVTAATRDNVTITLAGGKTVLWGSDEQSALKGAVLAALIASRPEAIRYDVTAPTVPVVADQ